ncbi:Triacylglycerol lipase, partial [Bertholletia excelsa]
MSPTTALFLALVQTCVLTPVVSSSGGAIPHFTTLLVFGDSTVDSGNNNFLPTAAKGDHPPYGDDFPGGVATGRFSNGKLVPDFLASLLGIKPAVPPFLDPGLSDRDLLSGVSFASAGSGYDDVTPAVSGAIPMSWQPAMLGSYVERLKGIVGEDETKNVIDSSLVIVSAGTNDFVISFYDLPVRRIEFGTIDVYQDFVLNKLQKFVKEIYSHGCRTIVISGLPPIGCLPIQITSRLDLVNRSCLEKQNSDSQAYNLKLQKLLPQLQSSLPGSRLLYADAYTPLSDIIKNPHKYGFTETRRGCCGTGLLEAGPLCSAKTPLCSQHSQYIFWDSIHPTEATYKYLADSISQSIFNQLLNTTSTPV